MTSNIQRGRRLLFGLTLASAAALAQLWTQNAIAQSENEALSNCLVMQTTGADRITLVRWIAFSFVAHPAIRGEIGLAPVAVEQADKAFAALFMDLLTVRCREEARAAYGADKTGKILGSAFRTLAQVSTQELYSNADVMNRFVGVQEYIDARRLDEVFGK